MKLTDKIDRSVNKIPNDIIGDTSSDLSLILDEQKIMEDKLLGHRNNLDKLWLTLDENEVDGITTKEFIHFTSYKEDMDKILFGEELTLNNSELWHSAIYALNLWKYLFHWNPSELMWALSWATDSGVIFTSPLVRWYNGNSESYIMDDSVMINPIEVIDAWEFFRRYWYNEKYSKYYGTTIEWFKWW